MDQLSDAAISRRLTQIAAFILSMSEGDLPRVTESLSQILRTIDRRWLIYGFCRKLFVAVEKTYPRGNRVSSPSRYAFSTKFLGAAQASLTAFTGETGYRMESGSIFASYTVLEAFAALCSIPWTVEALDHLTWAVIATPAAFYGIGPITTQLVREVLMPKIMASTHGLKSIPSLFYLIVPTDLPREMHKRVIRALHHEVQEEEEARTQRLEDEV